jgi:hypothetical protein
LTGHLLFNLKRTRAELQALLAALDPVIDLQAEIHRDRLRALARASYYRKRERDPEALRRQWRMAAKRKYQRDPEKFKKKQCARKKRQWAKNPERFREKGRRAYLRHREKRIARMRAYYQANKAQILAHKEQVRLLEWPCHLCGVKPTTSPTGLCARCRKRECKRCQKPFRMQWIGQKWHERCRPAEGPWG